MIYNVASQKLGVKPENCVVIEDSIVGLKAAKAAGMKCIITYTDSTKKEDFYGQGADAKLESLKGVSLQDIFDPVWVGSHEILANHRDSKSGQAATTNNESVKKDYSISKKSKIKPQSSDVISSPVSVEKTPASVEKTPIVEKIQKFEGWTPHYMIVKESPN